MGYTSGHKLQISKITDHKIIDFEIFAITGIAKKITMFCMIIRDEQRLD